MKRIIEKTKPEKIITSDHFSSMLKPLVAKNNIKIETQLRSNHEFLVPWNQFLIRFYIGKIPISISVSRITYDKIKNFLESIIGKMFGLWLNIKNRKKMIYIILLLFASLSFAEDFTLEDLNETSIFYGELVGPSSFTNEVSLVYFGHYN